MSKKPRIIEFKGFSQSGKTSIIESLIRYLKIEKFSVSSIKHVHMENFSIDTPGKNTYRMSEAGADPVVCLSEGETSFISRRSMEIGKIVNISQILAANESLDFILAEGFWDGKYPLIVTIISMEDLECLFSKMLDKPDSLKILKSIFCISGVISSNFKEKGKKEEIIEEIHSIIGSLKVDRKTKEYLKTIPIFNLRDNPSDFMKLVGGLPSL